MLKGVHKYPVFCLRAALLPQRALHGLSFLPDYYLSHLHLNFINFNGLTNYQALLPDFILSKASFIVFRVDGEMEIKGLPAYCASELCVSVPQPASTVSITVNCMCVHLCK